MMNRDDKKEWPNKNELAFLQLLHERMVNHPQKAPIYKPSDWKAMNKDMIAATGVNYGGEKLKAKFHRLRIRTRLFSRLLAHTGVTWDADFNTVHASEEIWEEFFKQDKKNFKSFRKSGCMNYSLLCEIFNHTTAARVSHYASTQMPRTEEEEHEPENELLSGGTQSSEQVGQKRGAVENSGDRHAKKDTRSLGLATRTKILEAETQPEDKAVTSPISDPYSVDNVMDVLESIEDVSSSSYSKALVRFHDPIWRQMFIKMSALRRKQWLDLL